MSNYQILDPKHDSINRNFSFILFVGELAPERAERMKKMCREGWIMDPPNPTATPEQKKAWVGVLKKINEKLLVYRERDTYKPADLPLTLDLQEYINSRIGEVIEITLPDRRKLGIYPDNEKLQGEFDIEYHASTAVNLAKLFNLFDASEIIIKEL